MESMFRFDEKEFVAELDRKREQQFLKQVRDYDGGQIASSMRLKGYKRIDSTERTVVFTFGEMTFSRNRWRKGKRNFIAKIIINIIINILTNIIIMV